MRQAGLRHEQRAARVDAEHEIDAFEVGLVERRERDRAGVVDADVEAAERLDRLGHRRLHLILEADVAGDRQRAPARLFDLGGSRVDRPFELRMRLGGLGGDRDIGAVARRAQCDREPDAAARAGDEECLALECRHGVFPRVSASTRREPRPHPAEKSEGSRDQAPNLQHNCPEERRGTGNRQEDEDERREARRLRRPVAECAAILLALLRRPDPRPPRSARPQSR